MILRRLLAEAFRGRAERVRLTAQNGMRFYPADSYGFELARVYLAFGDVYSSIADAIDRKQEAE
jgi:hypothetical protein